MNSEKMPDARGEFNRSVREGRIVIRQQESGFGCNKSYDTFEYI